jgi:hypothetical protein
MQTKFSLFESDENPFFSHELRMRKGYKPNYKSGLIAVRFQDEEVPSGTKYKDVDDEGKFRVNYQQMFSTRKENRPEFIDYFEEKYDVKISDYRDASDDFFIYFECKPGEEKKKIEEIAKDPIVKVVDYVDTRELENTEELRDIAKEIENFADQYTEQPLEESNKIIKTFIKRLRGLL